MPLGLWRKKHTIRRFNGCMEVQDGYAIPESCNDIIILMDVQTTKKGHVTDESGDYTLQRLKAFSDVSKNAKVSKSVYKYQVL